MSGAILYIVEPITVELAVVNPLKVAIVLRDLTLLWQFVPLASDDTVTRLSTDKSDSESRPLSYSNENDFCLVSAALCCADVIIVVISGLRHYECVVQLAASNLRSGRF